MATAAETAVREARQFIGGQWADAADGATFEDRDPYNGDVVATVPAGGAEDARRAIDAASAAFPAWSASPPAERQSIFLKAADILESRRDEVVSMLARETGATFGFGDVPDALRARPLPAGRRASATSRSARSSPRTIPARSRWASASRSASSARSRRGTPR